VRQATAADGRARRSRSTKPKNSSPKLTPAVPASTRPTTGRHAEAAAVVGMPKKRIALTIAVRAHSWPAGCNRRHGHRCQEHDQSDQGHERDQAWTLPRGRPPSPARGDGPRRPSRSRESQGRSCTGPGRDGHNRRAGPTSRLNGLDESIAEPAGRGREAKLAPQRELIHASAAVHGVGVATAS